jgi:mono/diheme cytochrome c family protein
MEKITRRTGLWALPALLIFFLFIQLIHPDWETLNGTATQPAGTEIQVPEDVKAILSSSCFACHSDQNRLSWFDQITPVSFLVASHIKKGKAALNFSKWNELTPPQQKAQLFYSLNKILEKEMPLASYVMVHPEAKLTSEKVAVLKQYIAGLAPRKTTVTREAATPGAQLTNRQQKPGTQTAGQDTALAYVRPATKPAVQAAGRSAVQSTVKPAIQAAPNGIEYIEGYGSWKAISTTDRFDNETMRVIFANDVAVKAIEDQHTDPWPDGVVFAKVAWKEKTDGHGNITPGEFYQAEFMIKDSKRYADTKGWGWARWRGMDLKPYGKDAGFTNECISCHAPQKDNDYVFTAPLNLTTLN